MKERKVHNCLFKRKLFQHKKLLQSPLPPLSSTASTPAPEFNKRSGSGDCWCDDSHDSGPCHSLHQHHRHQTQAQDQVFTRILDCKNIVHFVQQNKWFIIRKWALQLYHNVSVVTSHQCSGHSRRSSL